MREPAEILRDAKTIALVGASPKPAEEAGLDDVEDLCTAVVHGTEIRG